MSETKQKSIHDLEKELEEARKSMGDQSQKTLDLKEKVEAFHLNALHERKGWKFISCKNCAFKLNTALIPKDQVTFRKNRHSKQKGHEF